MALYGMARIEAVENDSRRTLAGPKAMALYQASLAVDPQNAQAANELGVLLARYGQLRQAKALLLQSVSIQPQPGTWRNLALVCQQLGEAQKASEAWSQHESLLAARDADDQNAAIPGVRWMDVDAFARSSPPDGDIMASPAPDAKGASAVKREGWMTSFGRWPILKKKPPEASESAPNSTRRGTSSE